MLILKHLRSLEAESVGSCTVWKRVEDGVLSAVKMTQNDDDKFGSTSIEKLTSQQNVTIAPILDTPPPSPPTDTETKTGKDSFAPPGAPPCAPPIAPPPPPQIEKPKGK